jgi:hypothetical protein
MIRLKDLDKTINVSVYLDDILIPVSEYTIEYAGGTVCFNEPLEPGNVVTVSGNSVSVTQSGGFFNWSLELTADTSDVTTFISNGWKENLPNIKSFTASAESYWCDASFLKNIGKEVIIALFVDTTSNLNRYEGYAVLSSDEIELAVDDIVNESIEFEGTGQIYYREG